MHDTKRNGPEHIGAILERVMAAKIAEVEALEAAYTATPRRPRPMHPQWAQEAEDSQDVPEAELAIPRCMVCGAPLEVDIGRPVACRPCQQAAHRARMAAARTERERRRPRGGRGRGSDGQEKGGTA